MNNIKDTINNLNNILENENEESSDLSNIAGMEEFASLLMLPDDQFALFAPVALEELDKAVNNVNDKMLLIQSFNASGMTVEDFQENFTTITETIDKELTALSSIKKNFIKEILFKIYNAVSDTEGIAKKIIKIPIELCHPNAKIPTYANPSDAGMDVYALEDITIAPGETKIVPTGIKIAIPIGYEIQVRPKSGRVLKTKLRVANSPGTIKVA